MKTDENPLARIHEAKRFFEATLPRAPELTIVLGSGLSGFSKEISDSKIIPFSEVPGGVASSVVGHDGRIVYGTIKGKTVMALAGRIHGFEGHSPHEVAHMVRSIRSWGCRRFIVTNATGSTSLKFKPGQLVLITDHINFTWRNPLTGTELFGGDRFPDVSDLYTKDWRKKVLALAKKLKINLKEGVYGGVPGPYYETAAEIKMYRKLGADICGMSTVWEVLALAQMKAEVLGISCVTNLCTGVSKQTLNHEEVLENSKKAQTSFNKLVKAIIEAA